MRCLRCAKEQFVKAGRDRAGRQIYQCATCARRQTERSTSAFCGYRCPDNIIALAVRWYLRFRLPYADIGELLAERVVHVDPSSVFDWVQRFTPLYQDAARPPRRRVGARWSIDETYIRIAGRWCDAFRAIDGPAWRRAGVATGWCGADDGRTESRRAYQVSRHDASSRWPPAQGCGVGDTCPILDGRDGHGPVSLALVCRRRELIARPPDSRAARDWPGRALGVSGCIG